MAHAMRFRLDPGWLPVLTGMGISISVLLQTAKIPADILSRESPSLSVDEYFRFWDALESLADSPDTPLAIGRSVRVGSFNAPILAALFSPNLVVCFDRLGRFKRLIGPMALHVDREGGGISVRLEIFAEGRAVPDFLVATELVFMLSLVRMATRADIVPLKVEADADLRKGAYTDFFGVAPRKGDLNRILFSAKDSERPFLTENATLWQFYEADLTKQLGEMEGDSSFSVRLRSAIIELMPSGLCGVEDAAKKLNLSARTVQRYLSAEGTTYNQQLTSSRELLAKHYLLKSRLTGAEISYLLGYDDPNSFPRAFHHWTGMSPEHYRKMNSASAGHTSRTGSAQSR
jgi:AraC-type DNA-binding domain-containing proteins